MITTPEAITISNSDVYVAGSQANTTQKSFIATYWKNGSPTALTDGTHASHAMDIWVINSDVYVVGDEFNSDTTSIAKYWKNGTAHSLTDGTKYATATNIYVLDNDVYIVGSDDNHIKYWKNGVLISTFPENAYVRGLFVK